eukprot:Colp12_sorted_trinity150504_noHs@21422
MSHYEEEESIYNLIQDEAHHENQREKYKSQFSKTVREEVKATKTVRKTLGPAEYPKPDPKNFLKKKPAEQSPSKTGGLSRAPAHNNVDKATVRRAPVPDKADAPVAAASTTKNFITLNAVDTINSIPPKPKNVPKVYVNKRDFGKIPEYILRRNEETKRHHEEQVLAETAAQEEQLGYKVLGEAERARLLQGLKKEWEKVNKEYQTMSLTIDSVPKIVRKEGFEAKLRDYEDLIKKLEKPYVLIAE